MRIVCKKNGVVLTRKGIADVVRPRGIIIPNGKRRMNILLKYPTRQRPQVFKEVITKYYNMASKIHRLQFVVTMDEDDATMNNNHIKEFCSSKPNLTYYYGNSKTKIQAVNANMDGHKFDILILVSDDMHPEVHGYDDIIVRHMLEHFPDLDGCLHYDDGRTGKSLNTLSIMGVNLYNQFGYIYHPDYRSFWCDNEFQEVTETLGKAVYIPQIIIRHVWDRYCKDALHRKNEVTGDNVIFKKRQALGFPKKSVLTP